MKLVYTKEAIADLERLRDFIAEHNSSAAARIGSQLIQRMQLLCSFPYIGKAVKQAPDPEAIRDMIFDTYIVRYIVTDKIIAILRIWHHLEDRNLN